MKWKDILPGDWIFVDRQNHQRSFDIITMFIISSVSDIPLGHDDTSSITMIITTRAGKRTFDTFNMLDESVLCSFGRLHHDDNIYVIRK